MQLHVPAINAVFTITENKQQLIKLICNGLTQDADYHNSNTSIHRHVVTGEIESPTEIHE